MPDSFIWTGDDTNEPQWMVDALKDGRVKVLAPGPDAYLLIHGQRFARGSLIRRSDVEGIK